MSRTTRADLDYLLKEVNTYLAPTVLRIEKNAVGYSLFRIIAHGVSNIPGIHTGMTTGELYHVLTGMLAAFSLHYERHA